MQFKNWLLKEDIYPNKTATVFHRTRDGYESSILASGFSSGSGAHYGKGFYATIDIDSQNKDKMIHLYGKSIVKFKVTNLDKYIAFNQDDAQKIHGSQWKVSQQLEKFGILNLFDQDFLQQIDDSMQETYTGSYAEAFSKTPNLQDHIKGMIFTGENDGHVFFKYDPVDDGTITMLATAYVPKANDEIKWKTSTAKSTVKSVYKMPKSQKRKDFSIDSNVNKDLIKAAGSGNVELVIKSIQRGADNFDEALEVAKVQGKYKIVKYLMPYASEKNKNEISLWAIRAGQKDLFKLAIKIGANNFKDALYEAAYHGQRDIFELILNAYNLDQKTIEHSSKIALDRGHVDISKLAVNYLQSKEQELKTPVQPVRNPWLSRLRGQSQSTQQPAQSQTAQEPAQQPAQEPAQQPAQPVRNPWLSRMRSKVGI